MMSLDHNEIQALLARGYSDMPASNFLLLRVTDAASCRAWLATCADAIYTIGHRLRFKHSDGSNGRDALHGLRLNLAFTHPGLLALGYPKAACGDFPEAFEVGMANSAHRSRILGDVARNAPTHWTWRDSAFHLLLLAYAENHDALASGVSALKRELSGHFSIETELPNYLPPDGKEHFGFQDGISQPYVQGLDLSGLPAAAIGPASIIKAGEFVLGYENEFAHRPHSPSVPSDSDRGGHLTDATRVASRRRVFALPGSAARDFGRNGTYVVVRQLEQHVERFHDHCLQEAAGDQTEARRLEAKLIGRWHDGSPLSLCPEAPNQQLARENRFTYAQDDLHGVHCPVGAHVRRGFPRDAKVDHVNGMSAERALVLTRQRRIIRRGRLYENRSEGTKGLLFVCLNSNIERQFEFVQHTWCNSEKFAGLYDERDPIVGTHGPNEAEGGRFTIPEAFLRKRLRGLPPFVTVRGGGYLFMPSISAIRYLAAL